MVSAQQVEYQSVLEIIMNYQTEKIESFYVLDQVAQCSAAS